MQITMFAVRCPVLLHQILRFAQNDSERTLRMTFLVTIDAADSCHQRSRRRSEGSVHLSLPMLTQCFHGDPKNIITNAMKS